LPPEKWREGADDGALPISCTAGIGLEAAARAIERKALTATGRKAARLRVRCGSPEELWLRSNVDAVSAIISDPEDANYLLVSAAVTQAELGRFKKVFVDLKNSN